MFNKLFQNAINQFHDVVSDRETGVIDEDAYIVACSDIDKTGDVREFLSMETLDSFDVFTHDGYTYRPFGELANPECVVFVEGVDETAATLSSMIAVSLGFVKQYYDEKYDRSNFVKNVILDNILSGDITMKARELHLIDQNRAVFLIRITSQADTSAYEIVQNLFPDKNKDFVFSITENDIVLVKEIKSSTEPKDLEKLARSISDTLSGELFVRVNIGIGGFVTLIKDLARSFKEAQIAIEVGKVFDTDKSIVGYSELGIARLIYHLPTTLCNTFLQEVFRRGSIETLDHETLFTIQKFFENNLNVSETSRKLFVHRNTLVYRLDKIKKLTGLDLREFEHAIVFKIALMVRKFLSNDPMKY